MKKHYRLTLLFLLSATLITSLAGCDWSSGGGADGFNSSRITVSVAGVYRSASPRSPIVTDYETDGSGDIEVVKGEQFATGDGIKSAFTASLNFSSIIPGTMKVFADTITLSDDGLGSLVGSPFGSGSINYETGAISIDLANPEIGQEAPPGSGVAITANYQYFVGLGVNPGAGSGASATTIYSFNVQQAGDSIRFVDNNGDTYTGKLGGSQITGNPESDATLVERMQFEVNGNSRGISVRITGTFTAYLNVQAVPESSEQITDGELLIQSTAYKQYSTQDLQMDGTWIEPKAQGNVRGIVY